jgi:hypothetical protein
MIRSIDITELNQTLVQNPQTLDYQTDNQAFGR